MELAYLPSIHPANICEVIFISASRDSIEALLCLSGGGWLGLLGFSWIYFHSEFCINKRTLGMKMSFLPTKFN